MSRFRSAIGRRVGAGLVVAGAAGCGFVVASLAAPVSAGAAPSPQSITCILPETGPKGGTGAVGETGATGPQGDSVVPLGPVRAVHLSGTPNCADIPVVCNFGVIPGPMGATGPIGATGPKGDTGVNQGPARSSHVRGLELCEGFPQECTYGVQGRPGDTGPIGATGQQGPAGAPNVGGPSRLVHRGVGGPAGSEVTLPLCELPNTGGSIPLLPYALLLVAAGGVVLMVVQHRRRNVA